MRKIKGNIYDETLTFFRDGYLFISKKCEKYQTKVFKTYLLGKKIICISGKDAAKIFYNDKLFYRKKATPKRVKQTLTGLKSIQSLDEQRHQKRKSLFISLADKKRVDEFLKYYKKELKKTIPIWQNQKEVIIFKEFQKILCKTACLWTGVPISEEELPYRAKDLITMMMAFGRFGMKHWQGKKARLRIENWLKEIIKQVRNNELTPDKDSALYIMSNYYDVNNKKLSHKMAAIEIINLLRPITAISTYITFMALAIHQHPEYKNKLKTNKNLEMFSHEVRRFYPFSPLVGARVKTPFVWEGYRFPAGAVVFLDIYGINHNPKLWHDPSTFLPERFQKPLSDPYIFIPHGGGPITGHRCPGELITVEIMKTTLSFLANQITYHVPKQNLSYNLSKIPSLPKSGFIIHITKE